MWTSNLAGRLFTVFTNLLWLSFVLSWTPTPTQSRHAPDSGENTHPACHLPPDWLGTWNQAQNDGSVIIKTILSEGIDDHGLCVNMTELKSSKFLTVQLVNRFQDECFRYMRLIRVHENVLKYKEGHTCHDDLNSALEDLGFEDTYHNLYRPEAIHCPFSNNSSYEFTYNKGGKSCTQSISHLRTCTTDSKRSLDFQACPDVAGTESRGKVLTCFGSWIEEGGNEYLFGQLSVKSYHDLSYRCLSLIRDADKEVVKVAFPEDTSCYPLDQELMAHHPQVLDLRPETLRGGTEIVAADLLSNVTRWVSLNESLHMSFSRSSSVDTLYFYDYQNSGASRLRSLYLLQLITNHETSEDHSIFSAVKISDCDRTPVCVHFYKRSSAVLEMATYEGDNCELVAASTLSLANIVTLIRNDAHIIDQFVPCPFPGKYSITKAKRSGDIIWKCSNQSFNTLVAGCVSSRHKGMCNDASQSSSSMQFYSSCLDSVALAAEFNCLASWEENSKTYVVVHQNIEGFNYNETTSSSSNNNNVITAQNQCLEIETTSDGVIYITSNRNSCKKSYKEGSPNEWEVTAVLLTDTSTDRLASASNSLVSSFMMLIAMLMLRRAM